MAAYKIKKDGDPLYSLFFLEKEKSLSDGIVFVKDFDTKTESDGSFVYTRNGRDSDSLKKIDCDLMIETVDKIDFHSYRKDFDRPFTVFQIERYEFKHVFDDPGLISSTDRLTVKYLRSWPDCKIKDAQEMDALITGIRREISLGKLGI